MKKSLTILICVMLFLCQNSLYVTAEAASVIQIENKKATKEQEQMKICALLRGIG